MLITHNDNNSINKCQHNHCDDWCKNCRPSILYKEIHCLILSWQNHRLHGHQTTQKLRRKSFPHVTFFFIFFYSTSAPYNISLLIFVFELFPSTLTQIGWAIFFQWARLLLSSRFNGFFTVSDFSQDLTCWPGMGEAFPRCFCNTAKFNRCLHFYHFPVRYAAEPFSGNLLSHACLRFNQFRHIL